MDKELTRFVEKLLNITPEEFLGLARLMEVRFVSYEGDKPIPREAEDIMLDMVNKYQEYNRKQRRQFNKLLKVVGTSKKAHKEDENGVTTDNK